MPEDPKSPIEDAVASASNTSKDKECVSSSFGQGVVESPANEERSTAEVTAPRGWVPSPVAKDRVDFINKCLQIMAICLGAVWAFFVFIETVVPGLEPKLNVTGDISWSPTTSDDVCEAHFALTVKNPGPGSLDVQSVIVKIWVEDLSDFKGENKEFLLQPLDQKVTALDKQIITGNENLQQAKPTAFESTDIEPITSDIQGHYPSNGENDSSQVLFFRKKPNTFTMIEVVLHGTGYKLYPFGREEIDNQGYAMDRVCGPIKEVTSPAKTPKP